MPIEPYIESPFVRTTTQPVSGGIDISGFQRLAQGISIRDLHRRNTSLLPWVNGGSEETFFEKLNFDSIPPYDASEPFADVNGRPYAENVVALRSQYPDTIYPGDYYEGNDGALEPLTIRNVAKFSYIENPISHQIRATLMDGNEDLLGASDRIVSYQEYTNARIENIPWVRIQRATITDFGADEDTYTYTLSEPLGEQYSTSAFVNLTNAANGSAGPTAGTITDRGGEDLGVHITITSRTTVLLTRHTDGENEDLTVDFEIWEYIGPSGGPNEWIVREQSTISVAPGQSPKSTSAISDAVDITKCIPVITGITLSGAGEGDDKRLFTATVVDSGGIKIQFSRGDDAAETAEIAYALVEFTGENWTIQDVSEHTFSLSDTTETEALSPSVDWDRTIIFSSLRTTTNDDHTIVCAVWPGSDGTTVRMRIDLTGGTTKVYLASNPQIMVYSEDSISGNGTSISIGESSFDIPLNFTIPNLKRAALRGSIKIDALGAFNYPNMHFDFKFANRKIVNFLRTRDDYASEWTYQAIVFLDQSEKRGTLSINQISYFDDIRQNYNEIPFTTSSLPQKTIRSFDDSRLHQLNLTLTDTGDIDAKILSMTGSLDNNLLPDLAKSTTSGFVYSNKEGTDSIAFGGFIK